MIAEHLREEHDEFRPLVEEIRWTADRIVSEIASGLSDKVDRQIEKTKLFLRRQLLPHAEVEERALYPVVAGILGGASATESMSYDHKILRHFTDMFFSLTEHEGELSATGASARVAPAKLGELLRVLYGLHALIALHLEKEEQIYLPLLATFPSSRLPVLQTRLPLISTLRDNSGLRSNIFNKPLQENRYRRLSVY